MAEPRLVVEHREHLWYLLAEASQLENMIMWLMTGVLEPLGSALTRLPAGAGYPGRTAGPAFEMYYQMGNFVPAREAAWAVLSERVAVLANRCAGAPGAQAVPAAVTTAAEHAASIAAQLAEHVPAGLRAITA